MIAPRVLGRNLSAAAPVITVRGLPAPQGSKKHMGNGVMVESSKHVKPWRQDVKYAALEAVGADWTLLEGPLVASMTFTFARPRSHFRTGRNAHLLRDAAPLCPTSPPDLSKILRSTEDALTGVVWKDDAQVVEYLRLAKFYAGSADPGVLDVPGCVIRIWPMIDLAVAVRR